VCTITQIPAELQFRISNILVIVQTYRHVHGWTGVKTICCCTTVLACAVTKRSTESLV